LTARLLFYIDDSFFHFGIANQLSEKFSELYAVVDTNPHLAMFLEKQSLVPFKKIFNIRKDTYDLKKNPDINYLQKSEEKYGINFWKLAFSDRSLVKGNPFYRFSQNEILCIFEHECKFFENILENIKPDYFLIKTTDHHRIHLLYEMCKSKGIQILSLSPTRIGYRIMISNDFDKFEKNKMNSSNVSSKDFNSNLESYFHKFNTSKQQKERGEGNLKLKSWLNNHFRNLDDGSFYLNFGRSRRKLFIRLLKFKIFRKIQRRQKFFDKYAIKKLDKKIPFIYFALHVEPERTLTITAPYFTNQIEVITHLAKSLPIDHKLYVKEHPFMMKKNLDLFREISYYKKINSLPNVEFIHPELNLEEIYHNCSVVATISGTSPIEAAFYKKPSIVFSDVSYSYLPFISRVHNLEDLPEIIKKNLNQKFDFSSLDEYVRTVHNNSFEFDFISFLNSGKEFYYNYLVNNDNLNEKDVKSFLDKHESEFIKLSKEYQLKINQIKSENTTRVRK